MTDFDIDLRPLNFENIALSLLKKFNAVNYADLTYNQKRGFYDIDTILTDRIMNVISRISQHNDEVCSIFFNESIIKKAMEYSCIEGNNIVRRENFNRIFQNTVFPEKVILTAIEFNELNEKKTII